ncbi:MAG: hypothetical protein A2900_00135 [Candidatus Chisholmbacteria bacterium RIFCSPLOWO2_01_FULL_50_28]|uniref:Uncharacterized protein n=1 Tax=Candidatus Chisholmbacteria bacterium RIFCSPHIGHO2_01_FULL_52_32 TaxID=1797591 RepID=A0A1G1VQT5_9BACT|nr:MAG: hypothetical protein A2786_00370 [Candidatus Chisholmbacteria bacterium RIFCSPHIGHO2_01_FULL_52_32]OGY20736.1 MAG: hypothetical protein A2900_00135 [Candidatus Chisholmbacteria bacterium RIFCSPLOWO2_01_FULL_50_28]
MIDFSDPQLLYMVLIIPSLFGFTLIGEGLHKLVKSDLGGWLSLIFGSLFIVVVILAYIVLRQI